MMPEPAAYLKAAHRAAATYGGFALKPPSDSS